MDEQLFHTLVAHVEQVQSARGGNEQRRSSTEWLEGFKRREDCVHYCTAALEPGACSAAVQFVCLKMLEDWALLRWDQVSGEEQCYIRQGFMSLLDNEALYQASRPMKTRLAKMVVDMAKRQYPHAWPSLLSELRELWLSVRVSGEVRGVSAKTAVCVYILTFLCEDVTDSDFNSTLSSTRRDEIIVALQEQLSGLLSFMYEWMVELQRHYCSLALQQQHNEELIVRRELLVSALHMLLPMLSLAKPEALCCVTSECASNSNCDFSQLALHLLSLPLSGSVNVSLDLHMGAARFLQALCECGRISKELFWSLVEHMPPGGHQLLESLQACPSLEATEALPLYRSLGESLGSLLSSHPEHLIEMAEVLARGVARGKGSVAKQERLLQCQQHSEKLQHCVALLSKLCVYPSRRLALVLVKDWSRFVRVEGLVVLEWLPSLLAHLLPVYERLTVKLWWRNGDLMSLEDSDSALEEDIMHEEFEDHEDYMEVFGQLRNAFSLLCAAVAELFPETAAEVLYQHTHNVLVQQYEAVLPLCGQYQQLQSTQQMVGEEIIGQLQRYVLKLESLAPLVETIVKAATRSVQTSTEDVASGSPQTSSTILLLGNVAELVLHWVPEVDGAFLLNSIRLVQVMHPLYALRPELLESAFMRFFSCMQFSGSSFIELLNSIGSTGGSGGFSSGGQPLHLSDAAQQVRRKTSAGVAVLAAECAPAITSSGLVPTLFAAAQEQMASGQLLNAQHTAMLETLVAMCENVSDIAARKQHLEEVLMDTVTQYISAASQQLVASPEALLNSAAQAVEEGIETSSFCLMKEKLSALASISRCIKAPAMPDEIYTSNQPFQFSDLETLLPFCSIWEAVLPQVYQSILSLHAIWHTKLRLDLCSNPQSSRLSAVYVECEGEVRVLSGVRGGQGMVVSLAGSAGGSTNGSTRYLLNSLRHQLYLILGQACVHSALYAGGGAPGSALDGFLQSLASDALSMESRHATNLVKHFVEPLVLHCPLDCAPMVSLFMAKFLTNLQNNLAVAWSDGPASNTDGLAWTQSLEAYQQFLIRQCSLAATQYVFQVPAEDTSNTLVLMSPTDTEGCLDAVRQKIIFDFTKTITNLLSACCLCRGGLALPPSVMATGSGGGGGKRKQDKKGGSASGAGVPSSTEEVTLTSRRVALSHLVFGLVPMTGQESYSPAAMTEPFMMILLQLLSVPNTIICMQAIEMSQYLVNLVVTENCLLLADFLGGQVFTTMLYILLSEEEWSAGSELQWALIGYMEECFSALVLRIRPGGLTQPSETSSWGSRSSALSEQPLLMLQQVQGVGPAEVDSLAQQLLQAQTKKKRRDLFKDFVKFLVEQHRRQQGNSGMQDPSTALRTPKARRGLSGGTGSQQTSLLDTEKDAYFAGLFD